MQGHEYGSDRICVDFCSWGTHTVATAKLKPVQIALQVDPEKKQKLHETQEAEVENAG